MDFCLSLVTLLCAIISCSALPNGAPQSACSSLMPVHRGIAAQRDRTPYTVSVNKIGNKVRITISSPIGDEFEGFMLQARSSNDRNKFIPGEFTTSQVSQTIECFKQKKSTLTHVNRDPKREVITEWTPSGSVKEDVIFRATVAKTFALFWTEIDSSSVKVRGDGSMPEADRNSNSRSIYDNCFNNKGCFGLPSGCAQQSDCEVLLTYSRAPDGIRFSMHGILDPSVYMAMGLSNDDRMGEDSVTECFRSGSNVISRESWNEGRSNTRTRELTRDRYNGTFSDGLTSCFWTRQFLMESNGRRYDLENENYYVLLAKGPVSNGRLGYHSDRIASTEAVNFTVFDAVEGEGVTDSVKIHGTFMVTAWVGFVSVAILLARHFKNTWENSTLGGVKIWFALHRAFMITAMLFVIVAFVVIFVHKNGWSVQPGNPHAILGCIATALGLFNPIMAVFRPGPDHPKRPIFNWFHWAVGNVAQIIAVITIFFAVNLTSAGLPTGVYWVMAIFVIVHLVFHFLFQAHAWTQGKKKNNDLSMNEMNGARTYSPQNGQNGQAKNVSADVFRILLLGIYCIFLLVILITLYAFIGVA